MIRNCVTYRFNIVSFIPLMPLTLMKAPLKLLIVLKKISQRPLLLVRIYLLALMPLKLLTG